MDDTGEKLYLAQFLSTGESWDEYLRRMQKRKQCGGHIELIAAANMLGVAICIVCDQPKQCCDTWVQPTTTISNDVLLLGFDSVSQHYFSLEGKINTSLCAHPITTYRDKNLCY